MTKKKIILYAVLLAVITTFGILLSNKFSKKTVNADNSEFTDYILAYTSGDISKTSVIRVQLTDEIVKKLTEKNKLPKNLFSFRPGIKGEYELKGDLLEFKPEKNMAPGKEYFAQFHLGKIKKVSEKLQDFSFKFKTITQAFDFTIEEQKTTDRKTLKYQQITGIVETADVEKKEDISKVFKAFQNDKELIIKWKDGIAGGLSHEFTIDGIVRFEKNSEVIFKWDGDEMEIDNKGEEKIQIYGVNEFSLISSKVVQSPEQHLQLQFSDPLDESQNLKGLISIQGQKNLRTIIDDNIIKVYPESQISNVKNVRIYTGIKNILGYKLKENENFEIAFASIKPNARFIGKGSILPSSDKGLIMPFEAVNLKAVDLTIIKIYANNILQFLQVNDFDGDYQLKRVGKPVLHKTVKLDKFKIKNFGVWNKFSLDLNNLIKPEPGAIYRIVMRFKKQYSLYDCGDTEDDSEETASVNDGWENVDNEATNWDSYENYSGGNYYYYDYWEDRNNPCKKAYYNRKTIARNVIASDLGIIAKQTNNGSIQVFVTDMKTAEAKEGVTIELYDYQEQQLKSAVTDKEGIVELGEFKNPFFAVAKLGKQRGFLKMSDGNSLSLSRFDISGNAVKEGLKGYIYGERGVWRPGDSIYLTYVMKQEGKALPKKHPVIFEFKNPQGQILQRAVQNINKTGFYTFKTKTEKEAPTGNYNLRVSLGSVYFNKAVKIETIKPNRLKIKLDFGKELLKYGIPLEAAMNVKWLHGAIAKDMEVQVDVSMNPVNTKFKKYNDFTFDDPTKRFSGASKRILSGRTDTKGNVNIYSNIEYNDKAPGMLRATFFTKVFEKGGNFSIDKYTLPYSPYKSYVGVKLPKGDKMRGMLLTDKKHKVELITLNPEGEILNENHKLEVKLYKLSWRWWWDASSNSVSSYNFRNSAKLLKEGNVITKGGKASWDLEIKYPAWGRYLVYTKDLTTGHSSGKIVYIDWPGWAGRAQKGDSEGAAMLSFVSDKKKYNVGEEAQLTIPTGKEGRALVSIETGTEILQTNWVKTKAGETEYKFKLTKKMSPNIYVHVTLLQQHSQTANDLPIRMYGVIPIMVEDAETHLEPEIVMPDILESEKPVSIKISEKRNNPMTYTIAVVEEGLLDLTRYKTPNPWNIFYAKEALGVKTWDIYNEVIGAYAGKLERLLSIGGDSDVDRDKGKKANRFKPVVKYLGPFTLESGSKTHTFKMPKYIGSVRTMVIAGNGKAYGSSEKATPVIKPLMVLGTLPRVLGPKEKVKLPVSIFVGEKKIKNVKVTVKTNNLLFVTGSSSKKLTFNDLGEQDLNFDIEVKSETGIGTVLITAMAGNFKSSFEIELDVRNPNHEATNVIAKVLQADETWTSDFSAVGIEGTNKGIIEISSIPPLNLESRLNYLIQYPHGCIEQTTSSVFPQLYVSNLIEIKSNKKSEMSKNIRAGIKRLNSFQISSGGFAYWQGGNNASLWGTNYAGHFLIEAGKKGYSVSASLMKKWRKYQKNKAKRWTNDGSSSQLIQAYRLYTLALAGYPERGAMNRLKNVSDLSQTAKWRLAAAYRIAGKKKVAENMLAGLTTDVSKYNELSNTYGSDVRDKAMILETLNLIGEKSKAFLVLKDISDALSEKRFLSTQTTAYALLSVSQYVKGNSMAKGTKYQYNYNDGKMNSVSDKKSVSQRSIAVNSTGKNNFSIKNTSGGVLYARLILQGVPDVGKADNSQNSLNMYVKYLLPDGSKLSPDNIPQGTDFIAEVTISNPGLRGNYEEMALSQIFPSGWEIINTRLFNLNLGKSTSTPEYIDIRDDRVYTYFDLQKSKSKTFRVLLNASYTGEYWMPPVYCEAMYDATINARKGGKFVKVVNNF